MQGCSRDNFKNFNAESPTEPKESPAWSETEADYYSQYVQKTWIVKSFFEEGYDFSSFTFDKIENGLIEGKFSTCSIFVPDYYYYLEDGAHHLGALTGQIENGKAVCEFSDKDGDNGHITMDFLGADEIEATIVYTEKNRVYHDTQLEGTFLFSPFNINDIPGFEKLEEHSFEVDLNSWGRVQFTTGKIFGWRRVPLVAYLTNDDGDVLYSFAVHLTHNINLAAISVQDVNNDGLKDVITIYRVAEDVVTQPGMVILQKEDGSFYESSELNLELYDFGCNKTISDIVQFLKNKYKIEE